MAVQLLPQADVPSGFYDKLGIGAFIEGGLGGWRIEYIGPSGEAFLKDWLTDSYDEIIVTPKP